MKAVHIVLQGKGGVGKSLIASLLAQHAADHNGEHPLCIDTDPVNRSFGAFKALDVRELPLLEGTEVEKRLFDGLIQEIIQAETDVIVDSGATSFLPLSTYLMENEIPALLEQHSRDLILHTVVTGGPQQNDTLAGFAGLAESFNMNRGLIVWLNPFWGAIDADGERFEDMAAVKRHGHTLRGVIQLPAMPKSTFGFDFEQMLKDHLTFEEALNSKSRGIMARQRLTMTRRDVYEELNRVLGEKVDA